MAENVSVPRVSLNLIQGCLVASLQVELEDCVLHQFQQDLLDKLASTRAKRVIMDCSGIEIMDEEDFRLLHRTIAMATLMGARTVLAGLQPGIVSALVEMQVSLDGIHTALTLDDAMRQLEGGPPTPSPKQLGRRG